MDPRLFDLHAVTKPTEVMEEVSGADFVLPPTHRGPPDHPRLRRRRMLAVTSATPGIERSEAERFDVEEVSGSGRRNVEGVRCR